MKVHTIVHHKCESPDARMGHYDTTETDEVLYSRIGTDAGEAAFRSLYDRHERRLYAYCLRMTGNMEEAKDVFQETFIRIYQSAGRSDRPMRFLPYMFTIAHNAAINTIKQRRRTVDVDHLEIPSHERGLEHDERVRRVQDAIAALPFQYREALVLREYDEFSYTDIAEIMNISVSAVKLRIFRARERLRVILASYVVES